MNCVGQRFHKLVVLEDLGRDDKKRHLWKCLCDCGTIKIVNGYNVKSGTIKSCGCITKNNLVGQIFGRLSVIENLGYKPKRHGTLYKCQCTCGSIVEVISHQLTGHHTQSCGCIKKQGLPYIVDLTGQKFGRLVVIKFDHTTRRAYWKCQCECGNIIIASGNTLNMGHTKSCGCLKLDRIHSYVKENNPAWKPELTDEDRKSRRASTKYQKWQYGIKERDKFTCRICKQKGGRLESHHMIPWKDCKDIPELRYNLDYGICLCHECHMKVHKEIRDGIKKWNIMKATITAGDQSLMDLEQKKNI